MKKGEQSKGGSEASEMRSCAVGACSSRKRMHGNEQGGRGCSPCMVSAYLDVSVTLKRRFFDRPGSTSERDGAKILGQQRLRCLLSPRAGEARTDKPMTEGVHGQLSSTETGSNLIIDKYSFDRSPSP